MEPFMTRHPRRISLTRLFIALSVISMIVLAATNLAGPFRGIFRVLVVVGLIAIVVSYAVEWWLKRRR
jgi:hypothetical protein